MDNRQGTIVAYAQTRLTTGQIAGNDGLIIHSQALDNTEGQLQSAAELTVDTQGQTLTNQQGVIATNTQATLTTGTLDNTKGLIAGNSGLTLRSQALDNTEGILQSVADLTVDTHGQTLINQQGMIAANAQTTLTTGHLNNTTGQIAGNGGLNIHSQALDNTEGKLQSAANLTVDTQGQKFTNQQGRVAAEGFVQLHSGELDNHQGHVQGGSKLEIDTGAVQLINRQGTLLSAGTTNIPPRALDNQQGQLQSVGDVSLRAAGQVNNHDGLIRGGQALSIGTETFINSAMQAKDKGIEANHLLLTAKTLNNTVGAIRTDIAQELHIHESVDNNRGLISSADRLMVTDNQKSSLKIHNLDGTFIAGKQGQIQAESLSGDGQILSQGDMDISLKQAFDNQKTVAANGNLRLHSAAGVTNHHHIKAGDTLELNTPQVNNTQAAEISAAHTHIETDNLLNHRLIDGESTSVRVGG
ncbi:hypothetical protein XCR1_1250022 [Xenorhabdus cabanillasii JM26]|uniref:Uncharacterized protein n=1 Tax=Xenorhabdus cabanillasii JM26 TaxID=1427517 RepID=W1IRJ2_9GAMM|nr:hemagglutinin [Xenorhabdus cabanillasii JM26]CDL79845.1 hypothetical protein XCR1_1250022 [Xenorhabdus cabanillasii JM26]